MQQTVEEFLPSLQPYIREILLGTIGLNAGAIQIADIRTGRAVLPGNEMTHCGDRFKIMIPYAGHSIMWEITFDSMRPTFCPDFFFSDDFMANPDMDDVEKNLPSIAYWDCRNSKSLLIAVNELLTLYKKYQVELLNDFQRFNFEYSSLLGEASIKEDDVEVLIGSGNALKKSRPTGGGGVTFLIRLNVDFKLLPPQPDARNYGDERALLRVTFYTADLSRIQPELLLSPRIEAVLGKTLNLPLFTAHDCLMDYVPAVRSLVLDRISGVVQAYEKRKEFIGALMHELDSVIEFDALSLTRATFLLERQNFFFLLNVVLTPNFPREKPILVLQSVYHSALGKPFETQGDDYPYSPRWPAPDMVRHALKYIDDLVVTFQQESVESAAQIG